MGRGELLWAWPEQYAFLFPLDLSLLPTYNATNYCSYALLPCLGISQLWTETSANSEPD